MRLLFFLLGIAEVYSRNITVSLNLPPEQEKEKEKPCHDPYSEGTVHHCMDKDSTSNDRTSKQIRLEVLPGKGWNALTDRETSVIMEYKYTNCHIKQDSHLQFLIPDGMFGSPIKESKRIFISAEESSESSTKTSKGSGMTTKVTAGVQKGGKSASIGASFSDEQRQSKEKMRRTNSVVTHLIEKWARYKISLQPGATLHPIFKSKLLEISAYIYKKKLRAAKYFAQLLIRDFGTHYVKSTTTGARYQKDTYTSKTSTSESEEEHQEEGQGVEASGDAGGKYGFSASYENKNSKAAGQNTSYSNSAKKETERAFGGPIPGVPGYETHAKWVDGITSNMVVVDTEGDFLYQLIDRSTLPEVPRWVTVQAAEIVKDAIDEYYHQNTYFGCMDRFALNYNFTANVHREEDCKFIDGTEIGGFVKDEDCHPDFPEKYPIVESLKGMYFWCGQKHLESTSSSTNSLKTDAKPLIDRDNINQKYNDYFSFSQTTQQDNSTKKTRWDNMFDEIFSYGSLNARREGLKKLPARQPKIGYFGGFVQTPGYCPKGYDEFLVTRMLKACFGKKENVARTTVIFGGTFSCNTVNDLAYKQKKCPYNYVSVLAGVIDKSCPVYFCKRMPYLTEAPATVTNPPYIEAPGPDDFIEKKERTQLMREWTEEPVDQTIEWILAPLCGVIFGAMTTLGFIFWKDIRKMIRTIKA